jgi:hypothetical protein
MSHTQRAMPNGTTTNSLHVKRPSEIRTPHCCRRARRKLMRPNPSSSGREISPLVDWKIGRFTFTNPANLSLFFDFGYRHEFFETRADAQEAAQ